MWELPGLRNWCNNLILQHDEKEVKGMMAPGAAGGLFLIAAGFFLAGGVGVYMTGQEKLKLISKVP